MKYALLLYNIYKYFIIFKYLHIVIWYEFHIAQFRILNPFYILLNFMS